VRASALVREQRVRDVPWDAIGEHGTGGEVAYDLLANELLLDGSARLNLFVEAVRKQTNSLQSFSAPLPQRPAEET
jgi:hypothetical protein